MSLCAETRVGLMSGANPNISDERYHGDKYEYAEDGVFTKLMIVDLYVL